jgi:hypothetical protein
MSPEKLEKNLRNPRDKKEIQEETKETLGLLELEMLVQKATEKADKKIAPKSYADLCEKNPELVALIKQVAEEFSMPEELLYATFEHESNFKHGLRGDWDLNSIGIGQIRPSAWKDIHTKRNKEFKEFRVLMEKHYPGKKFKRGENLFVDIAASAAYLKYLGNDNVDFDDKLRDHRLIYLRQQYKSGRGNTSQMTKFLDLAKEKCKKEKCEPVKKVYTDFVKTYRKYHDSRKEMAQAELPAK